MAIPQLPLEVVRIPAWSRFPWLRHGFSTRHPGLPTPARFTSSESADLNLGFTTDALPHAVRENRRRFADAVSGTPSLPVITVRQVHGTAIQLVGSAEASPAEAGLADEQGRAVVEADGLMTACPGLLLGIQTADCVPILIADTRLRIVAAFHAGWRGTVAGIVEKGVAQMRSQLGCCPEDLISAIGPAIGACCYTVGEEVRSMFHQAYPNAPSLFHERPTGLHLDLAEANRRQLLEAGLPLEAIQVVPECTACTRRADGSRKYFSYRAEHGLTGRAMGMIGLVF